MNDFARSPRVLIVEDDEEIALALQRSLRMEGYDVRLAGDGVDALDQAHAFLPDLVLLDLGLPKLDGIEVAKELRKREDDVAILMLTARDGLEDRVAGLDTGADDYLVKPFERQELLARLRALLRRRPPRGWMKVRLHSSARAPPGPRPKVPAASASVSPANRHSPPDANGRLLGRNGRSTRMAPAATSATGTP